MPGGASGIKLESLLKLADLQVTPPPPPSHPRGMVGGGEGPKEGGQVGDVPRPCLVYPFGRAASLLEFVAALVVANKEVTGGGEGMTPLGMEIEATREGAKWTQVGEGVMMSS